MRWTIGLCAVLTACTFDTSAPGNPGSANDGSVAADSASVAPDSIVAVTDAAKPDATEAPDAAAPDATPPDILYVLSTTGAANIVADFGGKGGGDFDEDCPDGRVVTGFDGDDTSNGICRLQAMCSLLTANPDGTVVTSDPQPTARHGNSGSFFAEDPLNCPANRVVVAARGRVSDAGIVRQFAIACAPLTWNYDATTYSIGTSTAVSGDIGVNAGTAASGTCAANEVAGGFGGAAGTLLDSFALHCFALAATPQ